ncbi:RecT family recombinase [Algicola sagamiensis]|uniref:RecT family recombinase n=1 Tax=Algicola sagamiensis TaxID=163869 RepID=UPI00035ED5EC|nr:recombinase RecT [Algicola sagamiensis]
MNELTPQDNPMNTTDLILDAAVMQQMISVANLMAQSRVTVPKHLQGAEPDCLAVVMQAAQWRMNPFAVAQKTHLVNGQLGYEAQLINAVISSSQAIVGRFRYEYQGDWPQGTGEINWHQFSKACVRVGAVLKGDEEITWGEWLYPATVGVKNSPLWKTNPKQQSAYLAVKYWSRLYCPDVILGVYTVDEFEDFPVLKERDITPTNHSDQPTESNRSEQLVKQLKANSPKEVDPALQAVLTQIENAHTEAELLEVAEKAKALPKELQHTARKAYKDKQDEIQLIIEESFDPETGELLGEGK